MHCTKPRVSVIVATRNRAQLLPRALDSIVAQSGRREVFDTEVIVVDDASIDETAEVVNRYPGVRYVRMPAQGGVGSARNAGIKVSTGRYIGFLDDDDEWLPRKLSAQVRALEEHPEAGVVYSRFFIAFDRGRMLYPSRSAPSGNILDRLLFDNFCGVPAVPLVRREVLAVVGGFDPQLSTCEDYDLWLRLASCTPFLFVPVPVAIYWKTVQGKQMSAVRDGRYASTLRHVVNRAVGRLPEADGDNDLKRRVQATTEVRIASALATVGDFAAAWQHVRTALRISPRITLNPGNRQTLAGIVGRYAATTVSAPATVNTIRIEMGSRLGRIGFRDRVYMRYLFADAYWHLASALTNGIGAFPTRTRQATIAAFRSFWNYSLALQFQTIARRLASSILPSGVGVWPKRRNDGPSRELGSIAAATLSHRRPRRARASNRHTGDSGPSKVI